MSYGVDAVVTASQPVTVSFYTKSSDSRAVGKVIQYYIYNYGASATAFAWNFTLGPVDVWQKQVFTYTPVYETMISYWFPQSGGVYSWEWSNMQVEQKSYATAFVAGTRGATVATGGGWADRSGNSNNGELVNGPTFNSSNLGSLVFDGSNDYIGLSNNIQSGYIMASYEFFVETGALPSNTIYQLYIQENSTWTALYNYNGSTFFGIDLNNGSGWFDENGGYTTGARTTSTLASNTKYHVLYTWGNSTVKVYLNGVLESTTSTLQAANGRQNVTQLGVGTTPRGIGYRDGYYWNGKIYQVKFYNRALSASEVLQNYNATKGRFGL
jgi:hypothetical protein